jgi:hypothetical protein
MHLAMLTVSVSLVASEEILKRRNSKIKEALA